MRGIYRSIAFLLWLTRCAAPTNADGIDVYVEAQIRQLHIPGLSLAIIQNGQIIKERGYGLANLELKTPASQDTVYEIGSNTKQFTAAAVMMLVEEGKINLSDSVRKYFPDAPKSWSGISVRHLLTHTSGIQNHVAVPGWLGVFKTNILGGTTPTRDALLRMFFKLPLEFRPGETWAYDNTGYYLLGIIIEKASGKSYWQFLDERIFKPLDMSATRSTDPQPIVPNRAAGYEWKETHFENRPVLAPFVAFSAGSLLSTVVDMAKWDAALTNGKLLLQTSFDQIWTAEKTRDGAEAPFDYGFGWFVDSYHGHRFVQHDGGTPGFSSVIYRFVNDKLTVIILCNHSDRILDQLAIDLAGICVPELKRLEQGADPNPKATERLREVFSKLLEGKHDPALVTPPMRLFLQTATGKSFGQWFTDHGALSSFVFSDREILPDGCRVRYRVRLGDNPYWFSFRLTKDDKVAQVSWW